MKYLRLFLPIILGSIVGFIISKSIDYPILIKPPLAPPKTLFPIVWSIIYILMGISYFLYRNKYDNNDTKALYYSQLVFNLLWSIIFFLFKLRFISIIWIIILDILVILLIKRFYNENKLSAYLNILYLVWIIFATYLNIGIYILNK